MSPPRAQCAPYIYVSFPRRRESIGRTLDNRPPNLQARRFGTCHPVIPAFAGMTGWPTGWPWPRTTIGMGWPALTLGMPLTAISMRFVGHALPGTKRGAASGKAQKYRAQINDAGLLVRRCDERNHVAFVATVNPKISAIHGDDTVFWKKLAHSDQAKIREVGLAVTVALR